MSQLLHASACSVKETEDGNLAALTLGAVSINAADLIPLVGEQIVLRTPGQKGRSFGGSVTALLVKDGKHGPEVTMKIAGAVELNGLVGTNVTIEAAQMDLTPVQSAVHEILVENDRLSKQVDKAMKEQPILAGAASAADPADEKHTTKPSPEALADAKALMEDF